MNRIELERSVFEILSTDMDAVNEYGMTEIIRRILWADDETLIKFLEEKGED